MLLKNLTLLSSGALVQVTNIGNADAARAGRDAAALNEGPRQPAAPQRSTQIVVTSSRPGSMASVSVHTGEPSIDGIESARRAAQSAADRAHLQTQIVNFAAALWQPIDDWLGMHSNRDAAVRAYAEAARLGAPDPAAEAAKLI